MLTQPFDKGANQKTPVDDVPVIKYADADPELKAQMDTPKSIAAKFSTLAAAPGSDAVLRKALESLDELSAALRDKLSLSAQLMPQEKKNSHERAVGINDVKAENGSPEIVAFAKGDGAKTVYRTALQVSFANAVTGKPAQEGVWNNYHILSGAPGWEVVSGNDVFAWGATPVRNHAKLWINVKVGANGKAEFTVQPDKSDEMPGRLLFGHHTFWSLYGLPLTGKDGFRHKTYTSDDGSLPPELVDDLLRLYKTGVAKNLFIKPPTVR